MIRCVKFSPFQNFCIRSWTVSTAVFSVHIGLLHAFTITAFEKNAATLRSANYYYKLRPLPLSKISVSALNCVDCSVFSTYLNVAQFSGFSTRVLIGLRKILSRGIPKHDREMSFLKYSKTEYAFIQGLEERYGVPLDFEVVAGVEGISSK